MSLEAIIITSTCCEFVCFNFSSYGTREIEYEPTSCEMAKFKTLFCLGKWGEVDYNKKCNKLSLRLPTVSFLKSICASFYGVFILCVCGSKRVLNQLYFAQLLPFIVVRFPGLLFLYIFTSASIFTFLFQIHKPSKAALIYAR